MAKEREILDGQIDMSIVDAFIVQIFYTLNENEGILDVVAVESEWDLKKLIDALRAGDESVLLETRLRTAYDTGSLTIKYEIRKLKIDEVKIEAVMASAE